MPKPVGYDWSLETNQSRNREKVLQLLVRRKYEGAVGEQSQLFEEQTDLQSVRTAQSWGSVEASRSLAYLDQRLDAGLEDHVGVEQEGA